MDRKLVEAEILVLAATILMGKATEEEVKRVTKLTIANNCQDILTKAFKDVGSVLSESR